MKDEALTQEVLVRLRGEFLNSGVPGAQASVTTKDELRGWIRALEWVLGHPSPLARAFLDDLSGSFARCHVRPLSRLEWSFRLRNGPGIDFHFEIYYAPLRGQSL